MFRSFARIIRFSPPTANPAIAALCLIALLLLELSGCTGWSKTDPAGSLGRWKSKPIQQRIFQTLSTAEEGQAEEFANAEDPTPEDLLVSPEDYAIGPEDTIDIQIFELVDPGVSDYQRVVVDDLGMVKIQHVGQIKAQGLTNSQLTERIKEVLYPNILMDPRVTVSVIGRTHRTFAIVGAVREPLRYFLDRSDYTLLDALAQAQDISSTNIPYLYVIRRPPASDLVQPEQEAEIEPSGEAVEPASLGRPELSPEEELENLLKALPTKNGNRADPDMSDIVYFSDVAHSQSASNPQAMSVDATSSTEPQKANKTQKRPFAWPLAKAGKKLPFAGRVIRIPMNELRAGNANYNIIIRKDDVVHVPLTEYGYYYMMGNINRPGTYTIGAIPVTLTRAIASAGNISPLAEPTKVDITRRIGENKQVIVQVDLAKIFSGVQPDYYIKADDIVNIGTSPVSPWLAVIRNGFRATYGFGFIYDRNYADRDVGRPFELPNLLFW